MFVDVPRAGGSIQSILMLLLPLLTSLTNNAVGASLCTLRISQHFSERSGVLLQANVLLFYCLKVCSHPKVRRGDGGGGGRGGGRGAEAVVVCYLVSFCWLVL